MTRDPGESYPTFDDDPAKWGLKEPEFASQAEATAAENRELWGPDGPPTWEQWVVEEAARRGPEAGG
jgi:hypothetical protein